MALTKPQDWFAAIDVTDAATAAARIAAEFDGWAPELTALITDSDTAPVLRPPLGLPVEHRWDRAPRVPLLGDAAHLAAPNGEGANLAMLDGAELGQALVAHLDDIEAGITEYEQTMFHRSTQVAAFEGAEVHRIDSGDNTAQGLINMFTEKGE